MTNRTRTVPILLALLSALASPTGILAQQSNAPPDLDPLQPVLPPGISDFDIELYTKLVYTWKSAEGENVIEALGDFSAEMGRHRLTGRDAVIWFKQVPWKDKPYYDIVIFLWQDAEVRAPDGALESGPALLVTLRTFGRFVLNADSHAGASDVDSNLFAEATRARKLLTVAPARAADEAPAPVAVSPSAEDLLAIQRVKTPKRVDFSVAPGGTMVHQQFGNQSVFIIRGDVMVSQGSPAESAEYVELRADAAVLYVNPDRLGSGVTGLFREEGEHRTGAGDTPASQPTAEPTLTGSDKSDRQRVSEWISAVYLEGDVVLNRGQRMIRASRLYYDFENSQALILDVVARALEPSRNLPIYVRADQVRQTAADRYMARDAQFTTSEFHTPHIAIAAGEIELVDRTPRDEAGRIIGIQAGTYKATNTSLNVDGHPILWWPVSSGDFSEDRMAFRGAKFGYNSDFGGIAETRWHFFNLLGLLNPEGFDATYRLDYFTKRGPGTGLDMDYQRENYFGLLRGYYILDQGEDDLGPRGGVPDHENRGRLLMRHRQYLADGWELTLEGAYLSDDQFLESFERNEFENGKEQETAMSLVKRKDNWQFSALANWRINEFLTQTEHLPDARFSLIGEPLADAATFYSDSSAGYVRYRPDDRRFFNGKYRTDNTGETGMVARTDTRDEMEFPLKLGPVNLTPYIAARGTAWDDTPEKRQNRHSQGGAQRGFGSYGVRGNVELAKTDESVESRLLDLHRLRHVVKADVTAFNAHSNMNPDNQTPFDSGVEDIDDFGGAALGLRQRFQTKRGGPGKWRTVDLLTIDLEAGFYHDKYPGDRTRGDFIMARPEDSISSNFIRAETQYRVSDSAVLVYDGTYDVNRDQMGTNGLSLAVEHDPRMGYFLGWRHIEDIDSNLFAFGANYKLSEKYTLGFRETYDIDEGRNLSTEFVFVQKWPRWYTAVSFDIDKTLDDVGVNFSIWPEGTSKLGLGSKRFTGLADSVGLRPE